MSDRPKMFFGEDYTIETIEAFLNGLNVGLQNVGFVRDHDILKRTIEEHGYEFSTKSLPSIVGEYMTDIEIITEQILQIEIEVWKQSKDIIK